MDKRPTSTEVAQAAGVSRATVSYVLNQRGDVRISESTRDRVLETARRLGYRPSPAARALRSGRGQVILLLVPDWETSGEIGRLLAEIGRLVSGHELVCLRFEGPQWQGQLTKLLGMVTAAAVITFEPLSAPDAAAIEQSTIPEVKAWLLDHPGRPHTTQLHQRDIVDAQVEHLLSSGRRHLIYLAVTDDRNSGFVDARMGVFEDVCQERGLTRFETKVADDVGAIEHTLRSLRRENEPLGVCAWSDITALGVLSASHALGLRVPQDIAVIGVDDSPLAPMTSPPLSSVRFDLTQVAAAVSKTLAETIGLEHVEEPADRVLVTVIRRETT